MPQARRPSSIRFGAPAQAVLRLPGGKNFRHQRAERLRLPDGKVALIEPDWVANSPASPCCSRLEAKAQLKHGQWLIAGASANREGEGVDMSLDLDVIRVKLIERAGEVAVALLGKLNHAMSSKRELRFGHHGSLAVMIAGPKAGLWHDHEVQEGGDLW